jgi:ATP-dependent Zn protease
MLLWVFVVLTVLSMVMENTGLLKAGTGPAEFEPEEGKTVKFSDVHGVEEAKNVSELWTYPGEYPRAHSIRNWKKSSIS